MKPSYSETWFNELGYNEYKIQSQMIIYYTILPGYITSCLL